MRKTVLSLTTALLLTGTAFAQEVKTDTEIVNEIKTVVMTIDADRPIDLKNFDWEENLTDAFANIPDEAVIGIRVNIGDRQLTSDIATLPNKTSFYVQDYAKNKRQMLTQVVRSVNDFINDDQQGNNIDDKQK
ncbi:hypothetical protein [Avrilella dinanensis]|uniref:Uncharacterized protein n=1 Tax=Avrilella dinanensis TaxID=2008672 RepID=A0A2M9R686_9FLAO|nr:hypothetical protein [Avrilella dinanensis]PJR04372.1 hypothetical protein CDL10_07350 [Avrilella dinanensis]